MKKHNTLIYGFEKNFGLKLLREFKKSFNFSYVINSHKEFSDINMQKLIVNTELLNNDLNQEVLKNYDKFFKEHFIIFYRMIVSRGINMKNIHEIKNEFSIYLHFFLNLIRKKKINLIILHSLPHQGPDYIIYILAKHFKIKIIMFYQTLFFNKYFLISNIDDFGKFNLIKRKILSKKNNQNSFKKIKASELTRYTQMVESIHKINLMKTTKSKNLTHIIKKPLRNFLVKTKIISRIDHHKNYLTELKNFTYKKDINKLLKKKFVYFPLHDQPELTTSTLGGIFEDQVHALEKLRSLIDKDCNIIIKDHKFQSFFQRDELFFKRLKKIKNLFMLPSNYPSTVLIKKCFFCSTIVGTAGWEALLEKKKSLVFGKAWYQKIHGCITYNDRFNKPKLKKLLKIKFDENAFCNSYYELRNKMFDGIIADNYQYLSKSKIDYETNSRKINYQIINYLKNYKH